MSVPVKSLSNLNGSAIRAPIDIIIVLDNILTTFGNQFIRQTKNVLEGVFVYRTAGKPALESIKQVGVPVITFAIYIVSIIITGNELNEANGIIGVNQLHFIKAPVMGIRVIVLYFLRKRDRKLFFCPELQCTFSFLAGDYGEKWYNN